MLMTATRHTNPVISVRLEEELLEQLDAILDRYPLFNRSQIIQEALRYWVEAALKNGVDATLRPLKGKG